MVTMTPMAASAATEIVHVVDHSTNRAPSVAFPDVSDKLAKTSSEDLQAGLESINPKNQSISAAQASASNLGDFSHAANFAKDSGPSNGKGR